MTQEQINKRACELCAINDGSGCTTPVPDPQHWICKEWLKRAIEDNKPTPNLSQLREQFAEVLFNLDTGITDYDISWWSISASVHDRYIAKASRFDPIIQSALPALAKEAGYVELAKDQTLPECPHHPSGERPCRYEQAQQDMLKADWVRTLELDD